MPLRSPFPALWLRQPVLLCRQSCLHRPPSRRQPTKRSLIAPPLPSSGPLLTRRSDRALPPLTNAYSPWLRTLPIFILLITVSALGIFNYQKQSSSIVSSTLYALRTSEVGRRELGDEIYFRDMWPWIWGEMNQLHGRVDINFGVKGTRGRALMRFKSVRRERMGKFETQEWSLEMEDGRKIQLLDEVREDPFKNTMLEGEE
ncbi:hypothetical protein MMC21_003092 [Puttea exsequens]|nr:hypothetical protein [Puttea exsequens]